MRIAYVTWADSHGCHSGWTDFEDLRRKSLPVCYSVGMVLQDDDEMMVLVPHWYQGDDGPCGLGDLCIPRQSIISVKILHDDDPSPQVDWSNLHNVQPYELTNIRPPNSWPSGPSPNISTTVGKKP